MLFRSRVVVIVFDDAHMTYDATVMDEAKRIARTVVDNMGPDDLGAVTFTDEGRRQNITPDHARLRDSISSLVPHPNLITGAGAGPPPCSYQGKYRGNYSCVFDTLVRAGEALKNAPPGRKTIVYIGTGVPFDFGMQDLASSGPETPHAESAIGVQAVLKTLQEANVNLYAVSPAGVVAGLFGPEQDSLRMFSEETGGRAVVGTNEPAEGVPQIFVENSSYYLLAIKSAVPGKDDQFRHTEIRVNRPGLEVRARSGYYVPNEKTARKAQPAPASPLQQAVNQAIPGGEMPLAISVSPFAIPNRKDSALAIMLELRESLPPGQRVEVAAMALDARCGDCKKLPQQRQTLTIGPPSGPEPAKHVEVLSRLVLPPGGYEVRVAASTDGRAGGVFTHIDVPDFGKDDLSASGLVLSTNPPLNNQKTLFADVIPLVPTGWRDFASDASVTAFERIYQGGSKAPASVKVTATIRDEFDLVKLERTTTVDGMNFLLTRSADFRLDLPLADLEPGRHVLHVEAVRGFETVRRDVRFTVR